MTIWGKETKEVLRTFAFYIGCLKDRKNKDAGLEVKRVMVAAKLGWEMAGGTSALELYTLG